MLNKYFFIANTFVADEYTDYRTSIFILKKKLMIILPINIYFVYKYIFILIWNKYITRYNIATYITQ